MAEVKNGQEPSLPTKRTPDLGTQQEEEEDTHGPKKQKLEDNNGGDAPEPQISKDIEKLVEQEEREEKQQEQEDEDEEEEDHSNGEAVIDRKGKGILIEEDEDEDDDDDSDSSSGSDSDIGDNLSDESDFADDPLAEVDLDNILPSRTRRRPAQPGSYIANDIPDEDSDESDDPDA